MQISFTVNGEKHVISAAPMKRLLDALRDELRLTGAKEGCGEGECGACAVLMDGLLVLSCMVPVCQVQNKTITTIEGISTDERLSRIQEAFQKHGGSQCGMCTPGMILAALYYIKNPAEAENVREALAGNQCRCTGYTRIFKSVEAALTP